MPETRSDTTLSPPVGTLLIRRRSAPRSPRPTGLQSSAHRLSGIRAVLFDIYGTLFVSGSGDVGTAMRHGGIDHFLESFADAVPELVGMRARTSDLPRSLGETARRAYFDAISRDHEHAHAQGIDHPEVDIRTVWEGVCEELAAAGYLGRAPRPDEIERLALAYELRANPVWPMPGVGRTLRALRTAGYPLGLVSNAQFFTPLLFPALLGAAATELGFREELCAYSYRLGRAKPSRALFEGPLAALRDGAGIDPSETLYVGNDMRNDIATAHAAGCRTCLFAGDERSLRLRDGDSAVSGIEPDAVIRSFGELRAVLSLGGRIPHA